MTTLTHPHPWRTTMYAIYLVITDLIASVVANEFINLK